MRLFVDSADADAARQAASLGYVYGVTTNPTLLRRAGLRRPDLDAWVQAVPDALREIHLQVYADDADGMVTEARTLHALDPARIVVKIPATPAGYRAAHLLGRDRVPVTMTAVFSVRQVILAAAVDARYAAVYVGRLPKDRWGLVRRMMAAAQAQRPPLRVLAASVRTANDVERLAMLSVPAATLPPDVLRALPEDPATARAVRRFRADAAYLR
ncbi:MAG: transaldolase family protein [Armatimonadota bacterium]|nr:transaldolase family protein [Armatimonadota bacterium]MDR7436706.1 transaldolase family protein [Armatimonadota bacterium]MDR7471222.1 transaldolase family protein [Armatimonadota bacterium]MDR7507358.1 transaldolase family protein [Armatimonadota bacterium]MDR7509725.1 transaldolase family protein [Armatimonadota bacterium]